MSHRASVLLGEATTKVGSGATPHGGEAAYKTSGVPLIRSMNVHFDGLRREGLAFLDAEQAAALKNVEVRARDVLLNITGASIGRVAIAPADLDGARVNQHVCIIRPTSDLDPNFLRWYLASPSMQRLIGGIESGATRQALTKEKILGFEVPLVSVQAQRRIVQEIEKQFSRLDEAVANLRRVKANLRRQRNSILQAVTSGEPPAEGRAVPEAQAWRWLSIEELASAEPRSIQSGPFGSNLRHSEFRPTGKLVIGIDNVRDGEFSIGSNHRISEDKFLELAKYAARPGDVLITVMATIGRVCVVPQDIEPAIITKHVYRITVDKELAVPEYVTIALRGSREVRAQLMDSVQGQTRPGLNGGLIKKIRLPIPPLPYQRSVVAEVDRRLSIVRGVEAQVEANLKRAESLRQAILAKAFAV